MPDIYTRVTVAPPPILEGLMAALELRSHGYVEALAPGFMLGSWVDMGATRSLPRDALIRLRGRS